MPSVLSVNKIWDQAEHSGLADLIFFRGNYFCSIRESDDHAGGRDGQIRIISSSDRIRWTSVALLSLSGTDLRDPMLSEMPDGRLLLTMGGSEYKRGKYQGCHPCVAFSANGSRWSDVEMLDMPQHWIWRVTWHKGAGYGVSYKTDPKDMENTPWVTTLFKTDDALTYTPITEFNVEKNPSEATLRFTSDDTMVALLRRQAPGVIGTAKPPYTRWKWTDIGFRLGGPNFLILPSGEMWAGSRLICAEKMTRTALIKMTPKTYEPVIVLPSGGDTSYPGLVYRNGLLDMCYYSTHESKTNVYLARIDLEPKAE